MKRLLNIKILVCFLIIVVGTYLLTDSLAIAAGVAILMLVVDTLVGAWADKKDKQYFGTKETDQDGETD